MKKSEEMLRMECDMKEHPELKEKLEAEIKRITEAGESKYTRETLVNAAAAMGYSITMEELERAEADMELLDDNELDSVAGGALPDNWCLAFWSCYLWAVPGLAF